MADSWREGDWRTVAWLIILLCKWHVLAFLPLFYPSRMRLMMQFWLLLDLSQRRANPIICEKYRTNRLINSIRSCFILCKSEHIQNVGSNAYAMMTWVLLLMGASLGGCLSYIMCLVKTCVCIPSVSVPIWDVEAIGNGSWEGGGGEVIIIRCHWQWSWHAEAITGLICFSDFKWVP